MDLFYFYRIYQIRYYRRPPVNINPLKPEMSTGYTLPSRSNYTLLISDIQTLWRSVLSARVSECQKLKM